MGYRYRKSKSFGGVRVTASKSGIGFSTGVKGFRVTKKAGGGYRTTASIPGTGISYVKDCSAGSGPATSGSTHGGSYMITDDPAPVPVDPRIKKCKRGFWWCLVLGIFFTPNSPFIGVPLLGGAIYFFVKKKKVAKEIAAAEANAATEAAAKQQAEAAARQAAIHAQMETWRNSQKELSARICQDYVSAGRISSHVVGTSFLNDDGSSRRNNLAFCYVGKKLEIRPFTYQGDPAYAVFTDDGQIGNIPATTAQEISEYGDDLIVTGEISQMLTDEYDDAYSCRVNLTVYRHK